MPLGDREREIPVFQWKRWGGMNVKRRDVKYKSGVAKQCDGDNSSVTLTVRLIFPQA